MPDGDVSVRRVSAASDSEVSSPDSSTADPAKSIAILVDDHRLLAQTLCWALARRGIDSRLPDDLHPATIVREVRTARESASVLVLLDLDLGAAGRGADRVRPLLAEGAQVLVVTGSGDECQLGSALAAGALGWVRKDLPFDDLVNAVAAAVAGRHVGDPGERRRLIDGWRRAEQQRRQRDEQVERLTGREREVLHALAIGERPEDIAAESVVSIGTVRTQIKSIFRKLGVSHQLAAAARAHDLQI